MSQNQSNYMQSGENKISEHLSNRFPKKLGNSLSRQSRLSISKKIALGYTLALSVTIVGTAIGFTLGNYYQRQAQAQKEQEFKEFRLVNNLKTTLLETQTHQHKVILLTNLKVWQQEYLHLLHHTNELSELWLEVKAYEKKASHSQENRSVEIPQFLRTYEGTSELYTQEITAVLKPVDLSNLTLEKISPIRKQLLDFTNGSVYLKLHSASDDLEKVVNASYNDLIGAEAAVMAAEKLRDGLFSSVCFCR